MSGPSFTEFFNNQRAQRQSSGESSLDINLSQDYGYQNQLAPGRPVVDEPGSLSRRDSNASMRSNHRRNGSTSSMHNRLGALRADSVGTRKESLPFDPESSSTLISTAQGAQQPRNNIGDIMFGSGQQQAQEHQLPAQQYQHRQQPPPHYPYTPPSAPQPNLNQWHGQPQYNQFQGPYNQQSPYSGHSGTPQTDNGMILSTDAYFLDQQSPYAAATFSAESTGGADWGQQFVGQENGLDGNNMLWTEDNVNSDVMLGAEDPLAELERMCVIMRVKVFTIQLDQLTRRLDGSYTREHTISSGSHGTPSFPLFTRTQLRPRF